MKQRRQKSGGQALVMVTMGLFAMCGMMGLAVDLGWSFFVQKQAQMAADGAAIASAHEAYVVLGGAVGGFSTSCPTGVDCVGGTCGAGTLGASSTSNLYNGCLYAKSNGFNWDVAGSNQTVTITAGYNSTPPTVNPGLKNVAYWATVRTNQTIPQLFSSLAGSTNGTVSAIATAALVAQTFPGSFIGLDREGDCFYSSKSGANECGVDLDVAGDAGSCGSGLAGKICGPRGIYLSSQCNGIDLPTDAPPGGCGTGNGNYAGYTHGAAQVWSSTTQIRGAGWVNAPAKWTPPPTNESSAGVFNDPEAGVPQPPFSATSAIPVCPILGGVMSAGTYGPYQYVPYIKVGAAYEMTTTVQLTTSGTVNFTSTGGCPYANGLATGAQGGTAQSGSFPTYIFYGGLNVGGTVNMGPGQYVLAGAETTNINSSADGTLLNVGGAMNSTNTGGGGNMIILATPSYPGLSTQETALASVNGLSNAFSSLTFYPGSTEWNGTGTLNGINQDSSAVQSAGLTQYGNILFWQDRNNSTVAYDSNGVVSSQTNSSCPQLTCTSPEFYFPDGSSSAVLTGVLYQPRGAWIDFAPGVSAIANSPLQIISGAIVTESGGGATTITLLGSAPSLVVYKTTLIQ